MSEKGNSLADRVQIAVKAAGGATKVSKALNIGRTTIYTWMPPAASSAPTIEEAAVLASLADVRGAWLLLGELPMRNSDSGLNDVAVGDDADTVEIPILSAPASAGAGALLAEAAEERGTVAFPRRWAREFGTPSRLRLVEIVGDSMSPDLDPGDWMLVNLDMIDVSEGIALVRLDDALLVKRLQLQGRQLLLNSTNHAYSPMVIDLLEDADRFNVIGQGRWKTKRLS